MRCNEHEISPILSFTKQIWKFWNSYFSVCCRIDTSLGGLVYEEQFLTITMKLPSSTVYGFGEHRKRRLKHEVDWHTWGMFNADVNPDVSNICQSYRLSSLKGWGQYRVASRNGCQLWHELGNNAFFPQNRVYLWSVISRGT